MKNYTLIILALLAAAVIPPSLTSAFTLTITQVQDARGAIVVTLSNSKPASKHWAESIAAKATGKVAVFLCDLPAGIYSAVVLASE